MPWLDGDPDDAQDSAMKVAKKSPLKSPPRTASRATLTLPAATYRQIEELRGDEPRSAWIQKVVENEARRRERENFAEQLRAEYTPAVTRETLALNREFPIHEK